MVTYSGSVEYHHELIKVANGRGTDRGYDWAVSVDEKRIIDGSFFVTFTGGATTGFSMFKLTSFDENINFINSVNNEGKDIKTSQPCYDDRLVFTGNAIPGDSRLQRNSVYTTTINPEKPIIEGGHMMFSGDKYTFMLMGKMKVKISTDTYTEETLPCLDTVIPPKSISNSTTVDFPIAISGEKTIDNREVLEGIYVYQDETSTDCKICLGGLSRMVHGDVNCSYISKIITSWTLVKREKECNASLNYLKGDVKINGVPAQKGNIKIGAGDVITTGSKSRVSFSLKNGNETYMLGSKSKLQLTDPCKPDIYNPPPKGLASVKFLTGKIFSQRCPGSYTRQDFNSEEEWQRFKSLHISWFRYGGTGVRGEISEAPQVLFASATLDLKDFVFSPPDSEKTELIPDIHSIPQEADAFYIHCEDGEVKDFTVVKGTLKIEDSVQLKNKIVSEGNTINAWDDGSKMIDIIIFSQ
jgi:hypothetical protein